MSAAWITRVALVAGVLAGVLVGPTSATAGVVNVKPGKNAIQRAIDNRASNGDTLRIHDGRYREDVAVDKRLTLTDAGDGRPVIDGRCDAERVINVRRNGVVVKGLKVVGATNNVAAAAVNFAFIELGAARDLVVRDTCGDGPSQGAGYGVNVHSSMIWVEDVNARGFSDAGIYIGLIEETGLGTLLVRGNETLGNAQGIIIEEVVGKADVRVEENDTHDNGTGIFVHDSDGVSFEGNSITDNAVGILIDAGSDNNFFLANTLSGNDDDLDDSGSGNCGSNNSPDLFPPCF